MGRTSLPPGFRFHPTDVELVMYYLKRKLIGRRIPFQVISEIDIYKFAPQDLPDKSCLKSKDLEWYFYCPRERKYANGARMNRATESGFWKTTGKDRPVYFNEQPVGMIKTLVFHEGRPPKGARTDWVMYEYRLEDKGLADTEVIQDGYVLCKIFKKSGPGPKNGAQYGAPFNEEDWNDDAEVNYAASLPLVGLSTAAPVLPHIQNSSIVTSTIVPACTCSGSSSEPGPSKTVQSPDKKLPSVPDDDNDMLLFQDDYISMSDLLNDCGTALSNENDKSEEVDKLNHDGNIGAAPSLDDIFDGLGDLNDAHKAGFTVDRMLSGDGLFLDELESPLKCPAESNESERIPTVGLPVYNNCYSNTELLCSQVNPYGTVNHSMFSPSLVLPEGNCAYNDHLDLFQKENSVKENGSHGYQECEATSNNANATLCKQSELEGSHNPQVQTRGEQQRKYSSRLQHLLESIPARPASAAEHLDPVNGVTRFKGSTLLSSYGCSSIHVKAEVTLGGGGCTKDALSDKLEEFPCMCCYGCNLPRRNSRKEAADYGNGFTFVFFVGILLALIWIFVGAVIITKLGRYAWSLVLS